MYENITVIRGESLDYTMPQTEYDLSAAELTMIVGGDDLSEYVSGDANGYVRIQIDDTSEMLVGEDRFYIKLGSSELLFRGSFYIEDIVK